MATADFSRLTIEEIDGEQRRVVLAGTLAPHGHVRSKAAFSLGGKVRKFLRWEFGSRTPTVHVVGTEEEPLAIEIHLRDSLLGYTGAADILFQKIDQMRRSARPLRIVWGDVLRIGMFDEAVFPVEGAGEYQGQLKFDIFSQGEPYRRILVTRKPISLTTDANALKDALDTGRASIATIPNLNLDLGSYIDSLYASATAPLALLLSLATDIDESVADLATALAHALQAAETLFGALTDCQRGLENAARTGVEQISGVSGADNALSQAAFRRAQADAAVALQAMRAQCWDLGTSLATRQLGQIASTTMTLGAEETIEQFAFRIGTEAATLRSLNPGVPILAPAGSKLRLPPGVTTP